MKLCYCILSLIFQFSLYSQNDTIAIDKPSNISVVSADKMNVVYRGVPNPISIAVSNAKSFVVSGNGLSFVKGKYILSAGLGKETKIIVEMENFNGSKLTEEHIFRIKGLPQPIGLLNGENCENCLVILRKKELKKSIISTKINDFLYIENDSDFFKVNSFEIVFTNNKIITVEGNMFNDEVISKILKLKNKTIFDINITNYGFYSYCLKRKVFPVKVILTD